MCGDYTGTVSNPHATLFGYGGAGVRAYTFSGSANVVVWRARATNLSAMSGPAVGYAVLTDSRRIWLKSTIVDGVDAGWGDAVPGGAPNRPAHAAGNEIGPDVTVTWIVRGCASDLDGHAGELFSVDPAAKARVIDAC